MTNKFMIALLSVALASCVVKNYDTSLSPEKKGDGTTIKWKDGSETKIKPPVIENRP